MRRELYFIRANRLNKYLYNDELKKTFWINIYNAYLLLLEEERGLDKNSFKVKRVRIGYNHISLNDIENKIIKVNPINDYLKMFSFFKSPFIKQVAIEKPDKTIKDQLYKNRNKSLI
ncbi:DUF547 domain-containing protein [Flavobacterium sp. NG2]|uniref:DUF547 domain-containing protein n=1 Tax=Flavobacterium sp. NG2 TaxID=3097547 RepID=UPI002A80F53A|nr:DUF547 domain-containing protein [Flavobacterium sp. NG2]WPR72216.1 DUF547 domain-containing protein [Flavobacterium sp. NG2]